jgi:hypothetical protein
VGGEGAGAPLREMREEAEKNAPQPTWTQKFEKLFEVA